MGKRRIIICCDGTWNDLEMRYITNVGRLIQALPVVGKSGQEDIPQLIYYDDGVGADSSGLQRLMQGGFGWGIDSLIYEAYRFIAINYEQGDEICLFGFSRGAYTVRSVAGMIGKVGLVPRSNLKKLPEALTAYRSRKPSIQAEFRKKWSDASVKVDLLACWDTVGALGIPDKIPFLSIDEMFKKRYRFHDTKIGSHIERAIHAVAIDERRKEFDATLMHRETDAPPTQKIVQRWFPGDHGCVGGGTWEKRGLSNRCLRWVVDQAKAWGIDLRADWSRLHDGAIADESIFFSEHVPLIYSKKNRKMKQGVVEWDDIDGTARQRWVDHPDYRPRGLKNRFLDKLNALPDDGARRPPTTETSLSVDQSVAVRVFAKEKTGRSHVQVKDGERCKVTVSSFQVWKDGGLDPCDVRGWNLVESGPTAMPPYVDGQPADLGAVRSSLIKMAHKRRVVRTANWFELVLRIGDEKRGRRLGIEKVDEDTPEFKAEFTAWRDGELHFAANDLASRFDLIDKYDNNVGWIWLGIKLVG